MNFANAIGFLGLGIAMWLLPVLQPAWFPLTAVDGSSTRALWTQLMGVVQCGIGVAFALRHFNELLELARKALPRGATATAQWEPDSTPVPVLAVDREAAGSRAFFPAAPAFAPRAGLSPHPFATALFRRHPKLSFVHLAQSRVVDLGTVQAPGDLENLEAMRRFLEQYAAVAEAQPRATRG